MTNNTPLKTGAWLLGALCLLTSALAEAASFSALTGKAQKQDGFIPLYLDQDAGKVYLEIRRDSEPFILYSGLPYGVGSNDIGLDRGQLGESRLVRFMVAGDKVLLNQLNTSFRADTDNAAEQRSVNEAFASSVLAGFPIAARSGDRLLIDFTPFMMSDVHGISARLKRRDQGDFKLDKDRSAVFADRIGNFADNTEVEALLTFASAKPGDYVAQVTPDPESLTVHQHLSLVRLPDNGYQPRRFHPQSGFWSLEYADYASPIEASLATRLIPRHRLEKRDPSAAISEVVEPIVYYLDPGVPEPVRSALLDGARWWAEAFEAAGFKNAYQVKMLPADADPMDVRYNVIQWVHRATRGWSYGGSIIDPRTGEILKGHVTLGSLRVRQDLLIATALTSPYKDTGSDIEPLKAMALDRIRQLSAHEVGHTLGLAHNFAASVNDRASVMDYPHPLVSLDDEGNISLESAYDRGIGEWDKFAIAWGYSQYPDAATERRELDKLLRDAKAEGLRYISDPDARSAGSAQGYASLWDNSDDPVAGLRGLLDVRARALENFSEAAIPVGTPFSELAETLVPLYLLHRYQSEAAAKLIGGFDYSYSVRGLDEPGLKPIPARMQRDALQALLTTLSPRTLTLPESVRDLIPPKAYGYRKTRESFDSQAGTLPDPLAMAEAGAGQTLGLLLHPERLARLNLQNTRDDEVPSAAEVIDAILADTLYAEPLEALSGLVRQRTGDRTLRALIDLVANPQATPEVRAAGFASLAGLEDWLKKQSKRRQPAGYDHYYLWQHQRLEQFLDSFENRLPNPAIPEPPGSPIGGN